MARLPQRHAIAPTPADPRQKRGEFFDLWLRSVVIDIAPPRDPSNPTDVGVATAQVSYAAYDYAANEADLLDQRTHAYVSDLWAAAAQYPAVAQAVGLVEHVAYWLYRRSHSAEVLAVELAKLEHLRDQAVIASCRTAIAEADAQLGK